MQPLTAVCAVSTRAVQSDDCYDRIQERGPEGRGTECQVEALHRFATLNARFSKFSNAIF